jgi:hypothetical protein
MPRVDLAAGFPQPAHEAAQGIGLVAKCGAPGVEVAVRHAVAQHVVARREHGRDPGEDRLPVAAPGLDAEEPGVDLGGLGAHARCGDRRGLEPGCAVAHVGGAALPVTLVVCRVKGPPTSRDGPPRAPPGRASATYGWTVNTVGRDVGPQHLDRACFWRAAP